MTEIEKLKEENRLLKTELARIQKKLRDVLNAETKVKDDDLNELHIKFISDLASFILGFIFGFLLIVLYLSVTI